MADAWQNMEEELAALRKAYASGVLKVRYSDREITYASGEDMRARIGTLERGIAASSASAPAPCVYAQFSRGT